MFGQGFGKLKQSEAYEGIPNMSVYIDERLERELSRVRASSSTLTTSKMPKADSEV